MKIAGSIRHHAYHYLPVSTNGTLVILAGVAGRRLLLVNYSLSATADATAQWKSGSANISGAMQLIKGVPLSAVDQRNGLLATEAGEDLVLVVSGGTVSGHVVVQEIEEI